MKKKKKTKKGKEITKILKLLYKMKFGILTLIPK
jgi:hypothetical protein